MGQTSSRSRTKPATGGLRAFGESHRPWRPPRPTHPPQGDDFIARQIATIRDAWDDICEEAALTEVERNLGQRIFLNDYIFEGTAEGLR